MHKENQPIGGFHQWTREINGLIEDRNGRAIALHFQQTSKMLNFAHIGDNWGVRLGCGSGTEPCADPATGLVADLRLHESDMAMEGHTAP